MQQDDQILGTPIEDPKELLAEMSAELTELAVNQRGPRERERWAARTLELDAFELVLDRDSLAAREFSMYARTGSSPFEFR